MASNPQEPQLNPYSDLLKLIGVAIVGFLLVVITLPLADWLMSKEELWLKTR